MALRIDYQGIHWHCITRSVYCESLGDTQHLQGSRLYPRHTLSVSGKHMKQITLFYLDDCLLGMDSAYVNAILPPTSMTKIPQKEEQLFRGMMKLTDGRFIHIINSTKLLSLPPSGKEPKVIVLQKNSFPMGLIVDGPTRLMEIDESAIARHLPISQIKTEYFAGTVTDKDGAVVLLMNMEVLLSALILS